MKDTTESFKNKAITERGLGKKDALGLYKLYRNGNGNLFALLSAASEIKEHFKGKTVSLCAIVNAKSGRCEEDCAFCAQSAHHCTEAPVYQLLSSDEILENARKSRDEGAHMFGIVTSGTAIDNNLEWRELLRAIRRIVDLGIRPCASLGMLSEQQARELAEAGLYRYHHNLETSRSFFHNICSTHEYDEDIRTIEAAREAGLFTCSGGIIGLGELMEQRIEMALTLKELKVDSLPVNILNPIPGTRLAAATPLLPTEILLTIALFRFILADKDIKLCGGKEKNLRQLLPLGLVAGCNSLMTGNYLTTTGRDTRLDLEMIRDLGLVASFSL
jgi:biotin synthase